MLDYVHASGVWQICVDSFDLHFNRYLVNVKMCPLAP